MPLTAKGTEIMSAMKKQYGEEEGERVFYASANKGTITGVHDDEDEPPTCPICGGPGMYLGKLGNREHFRCRNCGMDFSRQAEENVPVTDAAESARDHQRATLRAINQHNRTAWTKSTTDQMASAHDKALALDQQASALDSRAHRLSISDMKDAATALRVEASRLRMQAQELRR